MREAVIVSTARTGLAKSHRGGFNNTGGAAMAGHAIKHSIERAGIEPGEVSEVVLGCGTPQGTTGNNIGRVAALKAGCPVETTGVTACVATAPPPLLVCSCHKRLPHHHFQTLPKATEHQCRLRVVLARVWVG